MVKIDVRGLSCPIPVVRVKTVMDENPREQIVVLVDTAASKENVSRLAKSRGYSVTATEVVRGEYRLQLVPQEDCA